VAVKSNTRMQPKLNTAVERVDLFNLHPMVAINLHCIPTLVVEMCPEALKIKICGVAFNNHLTCATAVAVFVGGLPCLFWLPAGEMQPRFIKQPP